MDKTNPGTGSDLIKALRCLASQDADGNCHMDKYNRYLDNCNFSKKKESQMSCSGTSEGTIQCPYHQKTYGVCLEDGDCMDWLSTVADILEDTLEKSSDNPALGAARREIEMRIVSTYGGKRQGLIEAYNIISNYIHNGPESERSVGDGNKGSDIQALESRAED